jgi:hypothetical protein
MGVEGLPALGRNANTRCGRYHLLVLSAARASPVFNPAGINETGSTTNGYEQVFCW